MCAVNTRAQVCSPTGATPPVADQSVLQLSKLIPQTSAKATCCRPRASTERTLRAHASAASSSAPKHTTQQHPGTGFKPRHVLQLAWALLCIGYWLTSSMNAVARIGFLCIYATNAASASGLFPENGYSNPVSHVHICMDSLFSLAWC